MTKREETGIQSSGFLSTVSSQPSAGLSARTVTAGREALRGERHGPRALLPFAGPALIAAVAYIDPGNYATNLEAGARYNYDLLGVVVVASLIAMFLQGLSAKLGIVTGRNLAQLSREQFPRGVVWMMWGMSELAAMATDLAEFLGAAIGFSLLLKISLLDGMFITGLTTCLILGLQKRGFRPLELVISGLLGIVAISYGLEVVLVPPAWPAAVYHLVIPSFAGAGALTVSVGIIGATVMPHAIYLHSGLVQERIVPHGSDEKLKLLSYSNREVAVALTVAALINLAMVASAAVAFHHRTSGPALDLESAYQALIPLLGSAAAIIFIISLIASGVSSSAVGTMAGQVVMQGFVGFRIPVWVRRFLTMVPAFAIVAAGVNPTVALIMSQVVLSLVLPIPMISLLILTSRPDVMSSFVNSRMVSGTAFVAVAIVLSLNATLLVQLAGVRLW